MVFLIERGWSHSQRRRPTREFIALLGASWKLAVELLAHHLDSLPTHRGNLYRVYILSSPSWLSDSVTYP